MSLPFPPEILCEIALYLPLTEDVIALSLTNHAVRAALSTPALFKARLLSQKWDIDAWKDEDDRAQRPRDWKRWMRIDYIHSKTLQLFEEASAGGLSPPLVETPSESPSRDVRNVRDTRIDFGKTKDWSRRLSKVFPMFIVHHRANNVLRIADTKYCDALRAHLMVVTEFYYRMITPRSPDIHDRLSESLLTFGWLERACFGLVAFVMQCNTDTIESIFGDTWTAEGSPDFVAAMFSRLESGAMGLFPSTGSARVPTDIVDTSRRYSAGFLIQLMIRLKLHFDATRKSISLLPPSLPPMDPASRYDEPYELDSPAFVWPWLQDGLAGTPLAALSSASSHRWVGYYTDDGIDEPPRFLELYLEPLAPTADAPANKVYFRGDCTDGMDFTLEGSSDMQTGVVVARIVYEGDEDGDQSWDWDGVITPFGMVGVSGAEIGYWDAFRWWWIWPQEWSEKSPAPATMTQLDTTLTFAPHLELAP